MVDYFEIGHIDNTHGLKGELKVTPYTESKNRYEELKNILIDFDNNYKEYEIENVRYQKEIVLLKLKNIDIIEDAEKLKGRYIYIKREDAKPLEEGTHYIADLIGMQVFENQTQVGVLKDIFSAGAKDVYVIQRPSKDDLLLPGLDSVILNIDYDNNRIDVAIPEALR